MILFFDVVSFKEWEFSLEIITLLKTAMVYTVTVCTRDAV